jgi:hypothetical protein
VTALLITFAGRAAADVRPGAKEAVDDERLGLFPGRDYRLATGRCTDCAASRQALWYFQDDVIAVPQEGGRGLSSPVWIGSHHVLDDVRLSPDGAAAVSRDGSTVPLVRVPRLSTNRSYYDASTTAFLAGRPLRIRGEAVEGGGFVARTLWPEDQRLDPQRASLQPLAAGERVEALVTADEGGVRAPFSARVLWSRGDPSSARWDGRPVLGFVLSGAQGDDDEAHGGHFAVTTGIVGAGGQWADWMVDNFYNLDFVSEKGIVAARVPMDNYLMDLNSGQSYYRPVAVLVAVLREDQAPRRFQAAVDEVYERFYRHDLLYHHSAANCAGISMDLLRELGWQIPRRGPTGYAKATAAFFYVGITQHSVAQGEKTFDYLTEERTRLFPRAAFEVGGEDLLALLRGQRRPATDYERILAEDVEALVFLRVPQVPSSRALGTFPIGSFDEYRHRVPADTSRWKVVSIEPRPFPGALREGRAPRPRRSRAVPMATMAGLASASGVWGLVHVLRSWRRRG